MDNVELLRPNEELGKGINYHVFFFFFFRFAGIVGRAYWEASQIKLRRNRMLIRAARTTNMLLHSALQLLQAKELASRKESAGLVGIRKQAATLRSQFDGERAKSIALQILASNCTWNPQSCRTLKTIAVGSGSILFPLNCR